MICHAEYALPRFFFNVLHNAISKYHIKLKSKRTTALFHITTIFSTECKVFISYKKSKSCLGWRNRRGLYSNSLYARFRPIGFCTCFDIIASYLAKAPVQPSQVPPDGVRPDAYRGGQVTFHDAVLRLHLDVCCL